MSNLIEKFIFEDEDFYHSQSKSGKVLSSHMLMDFKDSPKFYHKKITGAILEKPKSAYTFGRACHKLILEGREAFDKQYTVCDGPINEKTGQPYGSSTKAYLEWKQSQTKEIISIADYAEMAKMNLGVQSNETAKKFLSSGVAEAVVRTEYCGVDCQIRMDWFNPEIGIIDLKTTAELKTFERDCFGFQYISQLAFYQALLEQFSGKQYNVYLIAVEKNEPYACGVWNLKQSILDTARAMNERTIERLVECRKTNSWPTGYEALRYIGD